MGFTASRARCRNLTYSADGHCSLHPRPTVLPTVPSADGAVIYLVRVAGEDNYCRYYYFRSLDTLRSKMFRIMLEFQQGTWADFLAHELTDAIANLGDEEVLVKEDILGHGMRSFSLYISRRDIH